MSVSATCKQCEKTVYRVMDCKKKRRDICDDLILKNETIIQKDGIIVLRNCHCCFVKKMS